MPGRLAADLLEARLNLWEADNGAVVRTGGAGKLGRACVDELIRHGWDVVVFDRVRPPPESGGCSFRTI
jgi:hypothetical protein